MNSFEETVKQIEKSEENVDKVLKAARLERHERQPMPEWKFKETLGLVKDILFGAAVLGFIFMYFWFMTGGACR